jgi:hypothetical protein
MYISKRKEEEETYEAITNSTNLLNPLLLLKVLNRLLNNRIHSVIRMGVIPSRPLRQPSHKVETVRAIQRECITVEEIGHEGVIAIGGELVGN